MKTFRLTVSRIGENLFDGEAEQIVLPGKDGQFTVLANHEPFVSLLKEGEARIKGADGKNYHLEIPEGGIAEISGNQATVIL